MPFVYLKNDFIYLKRIITLLKINFKKGYNLKFTYKSPKNEWKDILALLVSF